MKVCKFGGTSIGSVERMKNVANLISDNDPKIVVLSQPPVQPTIWKR